ncbi:MAG TPA: hypothetical protein VJ874_04570, partial [Candidatus Thermoplasmatota archaeon]|nr:hypothetical protein [Candidatus Thermoplasmatota archaeon]
MMKPLPFLLAFLLLSGCSEASESSLDTSSQPEPAPPPEERVKEWDGALTGVGKILPDGSVRFYGSFTTPERFTIDKNHTSLTVTMTWDHAVAQPFFLHILNGETNTRVQSSPPFDGTVGLTHQVNNPVAGQWSVIGLV